jgi:DNA polymerase
VARDILGEALVRLDDGGLRVVGHVHDEVLVEPPATLSEVRRMMVEPPAWASGLPIDASGFVCERYRKG